MLLLVACGEIEIDVFERRATYVDVGQIEPATDRPVGQAPEMREGVSLRSTVEPSASVRRRPRNPSGKSSRPTTGRQA